MKRTFENALFVTIFFLIVFNVCIFSSRSLFTLNTKSKTPLQGKTIFIDAGHGGVDPGKVQGDLKESDINLTFSFVLGEVLQSKGAKVLYSRTTADGLKAQGAEEWNKDEDMQLRVQQFSFSNADVVLSIHQNAFEQDPSCKGPQVFYSKDELLATLMQKHLDKASPYEKKRAITQRDNLYILNHTTKPIVIVELAFLSNEQDKNLILTKEYQNKLSFAIADALDEYFTT